MMAITLWTGILRPPFQTPIRLREPKRLTMLVTSRPGCEPHRVRQELAKSLMLSNIIRIRSTYLQHLSCNEKKR